VASPGGLRWSGYETISGLAPGEGHASGWILLVKLAETEAPDNRIQL
jgi:hypothetical protein